MTIRGLKSMSETYTYLWLHRRPRRWMGSTGSVHQQHQTVRKDLWPAKRATLVSKTQTNDCTKSFKFGDPEFTRRERGTVGHSCFHFRLIAVTPEAMNIIPKNRKICSEKSQIYNICQFQKPQPLELHMFKVKDTLCSQCKSSGSRKAIWTSAKSCNEWCSWWIFFWTGIL